MLENITVKAKNTFNLNGTLSESLLFYQNTNLILDIGSLKGAIEYCGYDNLIELSDSGQLSLKFTNQANGGGHVKDNQYMVSTFTNKTQTKNRVIKKVSEELYGRSIQTQQKTQNLIKRVTEHNLDLKKIQLSREELNNAENIKDAIIIETEGEINRDDINLEVEKISDGIYNIESNVDRSIIINSTSLITSSANEIIDAEMNNSAVLVNYQKSNYAQNKFNKIVKSALKEREEIKKFHNVVLPEYYDIAGTMNSGSKSFNEFMDIWRQARKFKEWLNEEGDEQEILTAYLRKISEKNWLEQLAPRNVRILLFTGLGLAIGDLAGGIAGLGLEVFDSYVLERLFDNWKPDQFVNGEYKEFLNLITDGL